MRVFQIAVAVLTFSASLAHAGLVEVNSSTYYRESGSPATEFLEVTLENAGEIRVSNVNLQDDAIEPTAATEVVLNGSPLMQPFTLPTGGSTVFPLADGTHTLEVTLAGKPGGGVKISFYEDKPDAPVQGKGWELLDDGTVLHRKTGLIWHRNTATPGEGTSSNSGKLPRDFPGTAYDYIADLNAGVYGVGPLEGNAGVSDWRIPTAEELRSVVDLRFSNPAISDEDGEGTVYDLPRLGHLGGMQFGAPLFVCPDPSSIAAGSNSEYTTGTDCDDVATLKRFQGSYNDGHFSSSTWSLPFYYVRYNWMLLIDQGILVYAPDDTGRDTKIWPVRGGQPQ